MKTHYMNSANAAANFVLGTLVGGLIGATLGLWFAPQSGKETKRQLRKEAVRLRQQLGDSVDGARAEIEHVTESVKNSAQTTVEGVAHKVDHVVHPG